MLCKVEVHTEDLTNQPPLRNCHKAEIPITLKEISSRNLSRTLPTFVSAESSLLYIQEHGRSGDRSWVTANADTM